MGGLLAALSRVTGQAREAGQLGGPRRLQTPQAQNSFLYFEFPGSVEGLLATAGTCSGHAILMPDFPARNTWVGGLWPEIHRARPAPARLLCPLGRRSRARIHTTNSFLPRFREKALKLDRLSATTCSAISHGERRADKFLVHHAHFALFPGEFQHCLDEVQAALGAARAAP